jgi:serine/threonine protein phosphatase 1
MYAKNIDGKVLVIGDTHGDYEQTKQLLGFVAKDKIIDDRWVVFIGDYVDMGPDTAKIIQLLLSFKKYHRNTTFCCGNHDLNLIKALNLIESPHHEFYWKRIWERNRTVLSSYNAKDGIELWNNMPVEHKDFLANLNWLVEHPDYYFVHCGFDPTENFELQLAELRRQDPNLFKPKWLYHNGLAFQGHAHQTTKTIISGHMHVPHVGAIDNKILIDTACGYGGPLSAVMLPEMALIQTEVPKRTMAFADMLHN